MPAAATSLRTRRTTYGATSRAIPLVPLGARNRLIRGATTCSLHQERTGGGGRWPRGGRAALASKGAGRGTKTIGWAALVGDMKAVKGNCSGREGIQIPILQGHSSQAGKHNWRVIVLILAVVISGSFVVGYVLVSLTVNSPAPEQQNAGWVALIQPASEPQADQVSLEMITGHGTVAILASACGPRPYKGELLLSGVIENPSAVNQYAIGDLFSGGGAAVTGLPVHTRDFTQFYSSPSGAGQSETFEQVQDISVRLSHVPSCASSPLVSRSQVEVDGSTSFPWLRSSSEVFGLWHGPHASFFGPLIGEMPNEFGTADFTMKGLAGTWAPPSRIKVHVEISTPDTWSIDSAEPALEPSLDNFPTWISQSAISPSAQFMDVSSAASLEDWIVLCAVGLGIGGGLIASLLLEFLHPHLSRIAYNPHGSRSGNDHPTPPQQTSHSAHSSLSVIGIAFVIYYIFRHRHKTQ